MTPAKVFLATMIAPTGKRWVRVGVAQGLGRTTLAMVRHCPYPVRKVAHVEMHSKPIAKKFARDLANALPRSGSINGWREIEDEHDLAGVYVVAMKYTGNQWPFTISEVKK